MPLLKLDRWVMALLLLGCGSTGDPLVRQWVFEGAIEVRGLALHQDGTYEAVWAAPLSPDVLDAQVERGHWSSGGGKLSFAPTAWSCGGEDPGYMVGYSLSGDLLTVLLPGETVIFGAGEAGPLDEVTGCFAGGAFVPQAVEALPTAVVPIASPY